MQIHSEEFIDIKCNEFDLNDKIELDECPICYQVNISDKVTNDCGHAACFDCFKSYFFYSLKRREKELKCFMCRQIVKGIKTSKENIFLLDCVLEEEKNQNINNRLTLHEQINEINFIHRRNLALRYLIPMLFLYLFYNVFNDNK